MVSDDFNNSVNVSNLELGRIFVREGKFDDAHRCFLAEVTLSDSANTLVYNDHGHLLNMMGRYDDAIVKFDSYLSSHPDYASSLFGKGISCIGLNRLGDALYWFNKALESDENHAGAWYYSAIIYANPFYDKYNSHISKAKECYKKYLNSRENYMNNPDYFNEPFHYLSLEEVHDYYNVSDSFRIIDKLLEDENIEESSDVLQWDLDDMRLFDDVSLVDKIDELKRNNNIEDKFESAGYDEDLIDGLSSRFGGLSIGDKAILVDLMDYFKGFRLSLTDINDLIREKVLEGEMSLDSINENREYIANTRIEENDEKLLNSVKKDVLNSVREDFKRKNAENMQLKDEIDELRNKNESLSKENESLSKENESLSKKFDKQKKKGKKYSNQPNSISAYDKLIKDMGSSIENLYTELIDQMESCLRDDFKNASYKNRLSGFKYMNYKKDLKVFKILKDNPNLSEDDFQKALKELQKFMEYYSDSSEDRFQKFLKELKDKYGISKESGLLELLDDKLHISKEDFQTVLKDLECRYGISKDVFNNFESAFKHFNESDFNEASDIFRDINLSEPFHSEELQIYGEFLEVTSLSREGKVKDAYEKIKSKIKIDEEIDDGLQIEKNPIRWFNFGNICFDYANSQSFKDSKKTYDLAYYCYDCAKKSFQLPIFKFSEEEKKKFLNNISWMLSSKPIYDYLNDFKEFKPEKIPKDLNVLNSEQKKIFYALSEIKKNKNEKIIY